MAGRKPKPTAVKKLEGNPGKRKLNKKEPVPEKGIPDCPDWLLPEAKTEWERLCEKLSQMGCSQKLIWLLLQRTASPLQDGRKRRNILILVVLLLKLKKDISNRHHGLELQIPIRN